MDKFEEDAKLNNDFKTAATSEGAGGKIGTGKKLDANVKRTKKFLRPFHFTDTEVPPFNSNGPMSVVSDLNSLDERQLRNMLEKIS